MLDLVAELVRDARTFLWVTAALVILLAIAAPIRTKWLEIVISPLQRAALLIAALAFLALPILTAPRPREETSGGTQPRGNAGADSVLSAPHIRFLSTPAQLEISQCLSAAAEGLHASNLTGVEANEEVAWGYADDYIGAVWCNAAQEQILFLAAGPSVERGQRLLETIRRRFPGSRR